MFHGRRTKLTVLRTWFWRCLSFARPSVLSLQVFFFMFSPACCLVKWILSSSVIIVFGKKELVFRFSLVCGSLYSVCHGYFTVSLSVISKLCSCHFGYFWTSAILFTITKTRLFKYTENFTTKKMKIFR